MQIVKKKKQQVAWLILLSALGSLAGYWMVSSPADPAPASSSIREASPTTAASTTHQAEPLQSTPASGVSTAPMPMPQLPAPPATPLPTARNFEYRDSGNGIAIATQPLQPSEYAQDRSLPIQQAVPFQLTPQKILNAYRAGEDLSFPLFDLGEVHVKFDNVNVNDSVVLADGTIRSNTAMDAGSHFSLGVSGSSVFGRFKIGQRQFVMYTGLFGHTLAEVDPLQMPQKYD